MGKAWQFGKMFFQVMEWTFGSLFCVEITIKIVAEPEEFWFGIYSWIDLMCVIFFLLGDIAVQFLPINAQTIRLLRLTRLGRLIRLARTLEGTDALYIMATAIGGSVKILLWALALLFIVQMTIALFMSQVLHAFYFEEASNLTINPEGPDD